MAVIEVLNLVKRYGAFAAVDDVSLKAPSGEFLSLLGPSGCGKTTTLRMIAGLIEPDRGDVYIGGERVNDKPIHKRNLGMVFQSYALFPHLTVGQNVGFGLKMRGLSKADIAAKVDWALALVRLPDVAGRYPHQLSGGQQQRIALARAVAVQPAVLLLDEPLSNLDAKLRDQMRVEIKQLQEKLGITTIYVTHDQAEALTMSDQVVILHRGRIEQAGRPRQVYESPGTPFVADFLGRSNFFVGRVAALGDGQAEVVTAKGLKLIVETTPALVQGAEVCLAVRPERIRLLEPSETGSDPNRAAGEIEFIAYLGALTQYQVRLETGERLIVERQNVHGSPVLNKGAGVFLEWSAADCLLTQIKNEAAPGSEGGPRPIGLEAEAR
ncbi:MAG: ABC transporter ATP-binding protein [Thermodesulfobacteriota bacterium]